MKIQLSKSPSRLLGFLMAICVGLVIATPGAPVDAKDKPKKAKKVSQAEPAPIDSVPMLKPKKPNLLKMGMSKKKVIKLYTKNNGVIDRDYVKRFREVEPGVQEDRLKYEIQQKKDRFRLSYVAFDSPPSSYDGSYMSNEFTYDNDEGAMKIRRKGKRRYFFFIKSKLWTVIDVYRLKEGGKWGETFEDAIKKLEDEKMLGKGRHRKANADTGPYYDEVDWADSKTHFRAAKWGKKKIAFFWVDKATEARLPELRKAKDKKKEDIDPSVKDVLR